MIAEATITLKTTTDLIAKDMSLLQVNMTKWPRAYFHNVSLGLKDGNHYNGI